MWHVVFFCKKNNTKTGGKIETLEKVPTFVGIVIKHNYFYTMNKHS